MTTLAPASKHISTMAATTAGLVLAASSGPRSQAMFGLTQTTSPRLTNRFIPPKPAIAFSVSWAAMRSICGLLVACGPAHLATVMSAVAVGAATRSADANAAAPAAVAAAERTRKSRLECLLIG